MLLDQDYFRFKYDSLSFSLYGEMFLACRELARIFGLEDYVTSLKLGIVMDLYYYIIQFARDNNFNKEKTSTLFSIVKKIHEICTGRLACSRHMHRLIVYLGIHKRVLHVAE